METLPPTLRERQARRAQFTNRITNRTYAPCESCGDPGVDWPPFCPSCRWYMRLAAVVFSRPKDCA